jgi:transposase
VKRGKSDALDAEAICEAVQRPTMRFVPTKTVEQQAILMAHRARSLLVRQRTMAANALRAHLAEFGLVANPGLARLATLAEQALSDRDGSLRAWVMRKFKRFKGHRTRASQLLERIARTQTGLFEHWRGGLGDAFA